MYGARIRPVLPPHRADRTMSPCPLDGTDQLARHVLAACVEPDGPVDVDGDQARVIDDARHPAFLAGGEAARPWDAATGARVRRPRRRRCSWPRLVAPLSRDHRPGRPWRRVDVGTAAPERCAWCHASDEAARAACRASGRDPGPATRCRTRCRSDPAAHRLRQIERRERSRHPAPGVGAQPFGCDEAAVGSLATVTAAGARSRHEIKGPSEVQDEVSRGALVSVRAGPWSSEGT